MSVHVVPTRVYFAIAAALFMLLAVTVFVAEINLGPFNIIIALTIAVIKALLVILYFMHVRYSSRLVWVFSGAGFFWLALMLTLAMSDFISRFPAPTPAP